MNVEQVGYLLRRAAHLLDEHNIEQIVSEAASFLEQLSQSPANADFSNELQKRLEQLSTINDQTRGTSFSPRELTLLEEMGLGFAVPSNVYQSTRAVLSKGSTFAASGAQDLKASLAEIKRIRKQMSSFEQLSASLRFEEVFGEFKPDADMGAEIAFFVPKDRANQSINALRDELKNFEFLISSAGELVGHRNYQVLYLSASDFGFILACYPQVVTLITVSLDMLTARLAQLKTLVDVVNWDYFSAGVKDAVKKEAEEQSEDRYLSVARAIAEELLKGDRAPNPEALTKYSKALSLTAAKIQDGYKFDARITFEREPIIEAADGSGDRFDEPTPEEIEMKEVVARLNRIESRLAETPLLPPPEKFEDPIE
ncbi:MAG: hypothetical protein ACK4Y9_14835 [Hyphomonas sp.]